MPASAPYARYPERTPLIESGEILVALVLVGIVTFVWYVAGHRYHLTNRQMAEFAIYGAGTRRSAARCLSGGPQRVSAQTS